MHPLVVGRYPHPVTAGAARYWHGQGWTDVVVRGDRTLHDPTPIAEDERRQAETDASTTVSYIAEATRRGRIDFEVSNTPRTDLQSLRTPRQPGAGPLVVIAWALAVMVAVSAQSLADDEPRPPGEPQNGNEPSASGEPGRVDNLSVSQTRWQRAVSLPGRILRRALRSRAVRVIAVVVVAMGLFVSTQGEFIADQIAGYVTDSRSPAIPAEWLVDDAVLRQAAESSRGTHDPDGEIRHTVDYPYQLLSALESSTFSVEANVTVIDGTGFLQHDPRAAVGMPLLEFLEYAAIADFPIVKLDLKRDLVGPIMTEVQQAIDQFGLDPGRVHFNADVFRGPGVENDMFGARADKSFTDRMYNLIVMELETSDLSRIAQHFPDSTIVISSTTATGPLDEGYSQNHLGQFITAANEVRRASPGQSLVFAVRGDLAARSGPQFVEALMVIEDSYVAAWWSSDAPSTPDEIETLRDGGVTFFDLGQERGH
jgi:hypothetical protein